MRTIEQVVNEFLEEQEARLSARTFKGYEDTMELFRACLDGYAYLSLGEDEGKPLGRLSSEEDKDFCEVFGPDRIGASETGEFLPTL